MYAYKYTISESYRGESSERKTDSIMYRNIVLEHLDK